MHRTAFARPQRRTRSRRSACTCGTRPLEDGPARHGASRCRTAAHRGSRWCSCRTHWCRINRARTGLRHDHASRRRLGDLNLRRGSCGSWRLLAGLDRRSLRLRWRSRRWWCDRVIRPHTGVWQNRARWRGRCGRSCRLWCRGGGLYDNGRLRSGRRRSCRRLWNHRGWARRSRRRVGGLLADSAEHVARLRDLREIDLRLDAGRLSRSRRPRGLGLLVARGKVLAHTLRLIGIERARVALLIVDADGRQIVYDRFALNLELARQIVDADLFQNSFQFQFPNL